MILDILLQIDEEGEHSHIAIRMRCQIPKFCYERLREAGCEVEEPGIQDRLDYIINSFSKITDKMKPPIREILRSADISNIGNLWTGCRQRW